MEQLPDKKHDKLNKLINPGLLDTPPPDFTADVMKKLGIAPAASAVSYEPVISKKGWFFISFIVAVILMITFMGADTSGPSAAGLKTQLIMQQVETSAGSFFTGSAMIYIAILSTSVFLLFFAESLFRQSRLRTAIS